MSFGPFRRSGAAIFCCVAIAASAPASALPGQTLARFEAWAASKTVFRVNLETTKSELSGFPQYHVRGADHGIAWDLSVMTDGRAVTQELFGISSGTGDIGSEPIRHDGSGYGFTFFRSVYGAAVASDFRHAKRIAQIRDAQAKAMSTFYRGRAYGYVVAGGYIALQTPAYFATHLARTRACAAHPERCSE